MSYYIVLWNLSEQGIEKVKEIPKRRENFRQICESEGVKILSHYMTFGEYDVVVILEAPDDASMMATLMSVESEGNARSTTLKAFTYEEAKKIIDNL